MAKMRKLCSYPMSLFYVYEDEVPPNTRVSTEEDCAKCNGFDDGSGKNDKESCDQVPYCLITE